MRPPRRRTLSAEERRLWAEVARSVSALPGRVVPAIAPPDPAPAPPPAEPGPRMAAGPARPAPKVSAAPRAPPLAPIDRKTLRAVARGRRTVDGVIDLHGMTQARAHGALVRFLARAQREGHGLVLVVTGKGGLAGTAEGGLHERGVLRRMVPHWLALPDLRGIVLGFDEAAPHQGGAGALYVRLRRARS